MFEWFLLPHSSGCGRRLFTRRGAMTPRLADCGGGGGEKGDNMSLQLGEETYFKNYICNIFLLIFIRKSFSVFICNHLHKASYTASCGGVPPHVIQVVSSLEKRSTATEAELAIELESGSTPRSPRHCRPVNFNFVQAPRRSVAAVPYSLF